MEHFHLLSSSELTSESSSELSSEALSSELSSELPSLPFPLPLPILAGMTLVALQLSQHTLLAPDATGSGLLP